MANSGEPTNHKKLSKFAITRSFP